MANFASDNTAPVHPNVLASLSKVNSGNVPAYGNDPVTQTLRQRMAEVFEAPDVTVFPVFNGSACNGLALAQMIRPYESVLCHRQSHIHNDECGLPEFFTGGKLVGLGGDGAKLTVEAIGDLVARTLDHAPHTSRPRVLSLTQSTELGTVYSLEELRALTAFARANGLYVHMDGARFANAVAALACRPAEVVAGVDILSFGGTKNGAMLAEAAVIFNPQLAANFAYVHKRGGQLPSKARYVSAQLVALLEDGLWLDLARHANAMALRLEAGLRTMEVGIIHPVEANELFVRLPAEKAKAVLARGHFFYLWPNEGANAYRLVTSFATTEDDVDGLLADLKAG